MKRKTTFLEWLKSRTNKNEFSEWLIRQATEYNLTTYSRIRDFLFWDSINQRPRCYCGLDSEERSLKTFRKSMQKFLALFDEYELSITAH
ncbi:MAG: hypothetical protein IK062_01075 [Selenomonadaceae bacterium]|nr:hypothetical protein [Selenomonadaceae bacterium]